MSDDYWIAGGTLNDPRIYIKHCGECFWYSGDDSNKTEFCDEKEIYVHRSDCCFRFKRKDL